MKKTGFNDNWTFRKEGEETFRPVIIPHDAMIHEEREPDGPGGSAHGYFPGGIYIYEKRFSVPEEWKDRNVILEFEGVYKNSSVAVNGQKAGGRPYGYVPFQICLDEYLRYGEENVITVTADNSLLPNSRWYTGSGIYRPVNLILGNRSHIKYQGVKITTLSCDPAKIRVQTETELSGSDSGAEVEVSISYKGEVVTSATGNDIELTIPDAHLWSDETPELYECHVKLKGNGAVVDEAEETFGIRTIEWSRKGLCINGKETLLRGGCVHHDNGILGAATFAKSEERRVRIMKEAGFNAIRSSHNMASLAMIEACDRYGMYLIDETFDTWYNRKNPYDYGCDFEQWWREDTRAMAERDYNHPSVIMYSIGNEVSEPHEEKGVRTGKEMVELLHETDGSRPVTCGVNLMIIGRAAKGNGIYQDGEQHTGATKQENGKKKGDTKGDKAGNKKEDQKQNKNTSLAFNIMASFIGTGMNKGGNSKKVDAVTTPFVDSLDIAGYNYGSGRYPLEETQHPDRVIFGSETFPQDIAKNWAMVRKYPYLVGDFMWTAWDYLGETGIGGWSYEGGMPFNRPYPWILGAAGVIDILGNADAQCRYAQTVWEQIDRPVIAVRPVNHPGVRVSKSVWRGTDAVESWSWKGRDGNKAVVEVYGHGARAELLINGKSVGKKKLKEYRAIFKTTYAGGKIEAVIYDDRGNVSGRHTMESASGEIRLLAEPEETTVKCGDIAYIPIRLAGENGVTESNADRKISVTVLGGKLLAFGSAAPCTEERYDAGEFTTYQGRAMAVVYAEQPGKIKVEFSENGKKTAEAQVTAEA